MAAVHDDAEKDYMAGMKYQEIADKYSVTINTVKSWKKRYVWERVKGAHKSEKGCTQNKRVQSVKSVSVDDGTKETLQNDELTSEQQMFCIYYSRTFNATQSYQKVYGCSYKSALCAGPRLLGNARVKTEIERLKELKRQMIIAGTDDVVEMQIRIAFSDIGDYLSFGRMEAETKSGNLIEINTVSLNESVNLDTQMIKKVSEGRDGISVELKDSQKAMDWLTDYFNMHPGDKHKQEFDKRKLELELLRIEMQTKESDSGIPVEDNFLDALNASAKEVWNNG